MQRNRHINLKIYAILGILFTVALGTLLHFVFEWSDKNRIVGFFSPINESTWEHIKMLAYPMLIFSGLEYIKLGHAYDNYIIAKSLGILSGMLSIIMLFYSYTGVIGNNNTVADIIVFILSVIIGYSISCYLLYHRTFRSSIFQPIGVLIILAIIIAFMWFTFFPPKIALFLDPATQTYGYDQVK
jgi:hypothetical protein